MTFEEWCPYKKDLPRIGGYTVRNPQYTAALFAWKAATEAERDRVGLLLQEIRAHWITANGPESITIGALDTIAEVIADGSYIRARGKE